MIFRFIKRRIANEAYMNASRIAELHAWSNQNTQHFGPEQNSIQIAIKIRAEIK